MDFEYAYSGNELDVFYLARNWKAYWAGELRPYLGSDVLEVGAGTGSNTELLCSARHTRWLCLEPDEALLRGLARRVETHPCRAVIEARRGTLESIAEGERFDTILYIDVLEHIEDDRRELESASRLLRGGGFLVVLAPAHQWLYSPFDRAIGHYRRYSKESLAATAPGRLEPQRLFYLDSAGLLTSAANLLCLRQSLPTAGQIRFWDRWIVPVSVRMDRWLRLALGKTVVGVWRNERG
jgi:SAM-dependent methyltransferase